jgi:hypothetical protein
MYAHMHASARVRRCVCVYSGVCSERKEGRNEGDRTKDRRMKINEGGVEDKTQEDTCMNVYIHMYMHACTCACVCV